MPGPEVGRAYVTIIPSLQGAQQTITQELTGASAPAGAAAGKTTGASLASSLGKSLSSAGTKLTAAVTVPLAGIGTAAFKSASNFETAFAQLTTIADTSSVSVDDLKSGVMDLSSELGISSSEISAAAYSAISAGQDTADALGFVTSAAKLARGGFTDVSTATDVLTTALNAYGLEADQVAHVSDVLIETQNEGKTTVDELAASMGRVIPTAANVNVGLEDLASQYVALTKNGIGTAEATTYINSMLNELGKTGTTAFDMFKEAAGMTFPEYIASGHSTTEAMEVLAGACEEAGLSVSDAFGSAEAGKAANVLVQHAEDSTTALGNMRTMAGQTEEAYATMSDTTAVRMEEMKTKLENLAITIGDQLIPMLEPFVEKITSGIETISEKWSSLDSDTQQMIITIAGVVAVVGPLLVIGGKIAGGISSIIGFIGGLGGAISGVVGHIGNGASSLGSFASSATSAASGAAGAATSFGTLAGQALLLIAAGAAVYIIAQAMKVLVSAAIELANAGPLAIATFVGIAAVAVGVTAAIVAIGSAATVSAVGLLAMGAAVLMVSAGIALIIVSLTAFVGQLPLVATYGSSAASALLQISVAMVTLAASTLYVTASVAAMAAILAVTTVTFLTVTASTVAMEAAFALLLAELLLVDGEAVLLNAALALVRGTMDGISKSASDTAAKLQEMVTSVNIVEKGLNSLESLASGAVSALVSVFSSGMSSMESTVTASMSNIQSGMSSGMTAVKTSVSSGIAAIKSAVSTGMNANKSLVTSGTSAIKKTVSTCLSTVKTSVSTGMTAVKSVITLNVTGIKTALALGVNAMKITVQAGSTAIYKGWATVMSRLLASTRNTMSQLYSTASSAVNSIAWKFASTTLRFNHYIAMPHFWMYGSFNAQTGSVPSVGVSWYKRAATEGALFTTPQIIGVGDASQPELLIGEEKLKELIGGGDQNITINVYGAVGQDVEALADAIERKLVSKINRRKAAFA